MGEGGGGTKQSELVGFAQVRARAGKARVATNKLIFKITSSAVSAMW